MPVRSFHHVSTQTKSNARPSSGVVLGSIGWTDARLGSEEACEVSKGIWKGLPEEKEGYDSLLVLRIGWDFWVFAESLLMLLHKSSYCLPRDSCSSSIHHPWYRTWWYQLRGKGGCRQTTLAVEVEVQRDQALT